MSIGIMSLIFGLDFKTCSRKMLAVKLADHADDDGCGIWPSVERLARSCNLSTRQVQRLLADFVREGFLVKISEGGKGKRSTTRYDFDLTKLPGREIEASNPVENDANSKGDTMSPYDQSKGDTVSSKGDTDDTLGRLPVTQTIKEPSINHHSLSAGAEKPPDGGERETALPDGCADDCPNGCPVGWKGDESDFLKSWNTYDDKFGSVMISSRGEWFKLTIGDRWIASHRISVFKTGRKAAGRTKLPAFSTYLGKRMFDQIEDPAATTSDPCADGRQVLKPFGKAWAVVRLSVLRNGAKPVDAKVSTFKRDRERFPFVMRLDGGPVVTLEAERAVSVEILNGCQQVRVGSAEWLAWQNYHETMDWPFIAAPEGLEWVWFPAAQPQDWAHYQPEARSA